MINYLHEIFGLDVKIENWGGKNKLPLYLRNKRDYFVLSIGKAQSILMKNSSGNFNVSVFEKETKEIEKLSGMTVVLSEIFSQLSLFYRHIILLSTFPTPEYKSAN